MAGKRKSIAQGSARHIRTATHALMPAKIYEQALRYAHSIALDDVEAAQWIINELEIRDREATRREYSKIRLKLRHLYGQPCVYCGKPADSIDHRIPIAKGGTNDLSNLQPMCWPCNRKKSGSLIQRNNNG